MTNSDSQIDLQAAVSPDTIAPQLAKLQRFALIAAVVGVALTAVGAIANLDHFFQAYLLAYLFWFGIVAGCIGLLCLHNTVGGGWGFIIRRPMEAATRTLPLMALLFIPIAISVFMGGHSLYEWARPAAATDQVIQDKSMYLNPPFFVARAVLYFVIWGLITFFLNKWSRILDKRDDPAAVHKANLLGAAGVPVHVLLVTFMAVDWAMSLTPHWMSSIYGFIFVAGQVLSALALMNIFNGTLGRANPLTKLVPDKYFRDLGNLMMAVVLVWAYCAFSQYLIQYSGNIAEEVGWYTLRRQGGWGLIGLMLVFGNFALPFLVLLSSSMKTNPASTAKIAGFILFTRWVDLLYLTRPTFSSTLAGGLYLSDIGTMLLMGGIWLWVWADQVKKQPLVPLHDPRFVVGWQVDQFEHAHGHDARHPESHHGDDSAAQSLPSGAEVKAHV